MTTKTKAPDLCYKCKASLPPLPSHLTWRASYLCEDCLEKHKAEWREEHTRKPGDTRKGWLIGDECRVALNKVIYDAKILDMSDVADGDYFWMKLELSKTVKGLDGKNYTQTWIHPKPVQSYKLRKPLLKGDV